MRRQWRSNVDHLIIGRFDPDPARVKMELSTDAAGQKGFWATIFCVSHNWVAD